MRRGAFAIVLAAGHGDRLMASVLTREQLTKAHLPLDPVIAVSVGAAVQHGPAPPLAETGLPAAKGAVRLDLP